MSTTNTQTQYPFSLLFWNNSTGAQCGGSITLTSEVGIDDATALAFLAALRSVSVPTGITVTVDLTKETNIGTEYTPDLTSTPPSFT